MEFISTLNAIKSVFSTLGAKTTNDNYAVQLCDNTSGEPKGFMDISDLASVLGVLRRLGTSTDFNETKDLGIYHRWAGDVSNAPSTDIDTYYLLVIPYSSNLIVQFCYAQGKKILYHRGYSSGTWGDWTAIQNEPIN